MTDKIRLESLLHQLKSFSDDESYFNDLYTLLKTEYSRSGGDIYKGEEDTYNDDLRITLKTANLFHSVNKTKKQGIYFLAKTDFIHDVENELDRLEEHFGPPVE